MMKHEFLAKLNALENKIGDILTPNVNDEDYEIIEYVYTWYPESSLDQTATAILYKDFGIKIFYDMKHRAEVAERLEHHKHELLVEVKVVEQELLDLEWGGVINE